MFQQAKDLFKLQRQAKKMKKELAKIHITAEAEGIKVVVSAEQEIVDIEIDESVPREEIPARLKDAIGRAFKKAQVVAAEKMQGIMGDLGLGGGEGGMPGLPGMPGS